MIEWLAMNLADRLPKRVAYWCWIRVNAYLTTQVYPNRTPDEVSIMDGLKKLDSWAGRR